MCGLVGVAGKLAVKDERLIKALLVFDVFRGPDSTGLAAIRTGGEAKLAKVASHPLDLFDMQRFKETLSGYNSTVFLGHNRSATRGAVNNVNAHPFEFGHIVGAHNGTLDESSKLALEAAVGEKFNVDSQAIFAAIEKIGIDATIPLLQGAWALTWYDRTDGSLNFIRNNKRPLWYAYTKEFDRIFWSSEWEILKAAAAINPQPYEFFVSDGGHSFFQFAENIHYKYDIASLKAGSDTRPKPVAKELKGKEPKPVVTTAGGADPFDRGGHGPSSQTTSSTHGGAGTNPRTPTSTTTSRGNSTLKHLLGHDKDPFAGVISLEEFIVKAKNGCGYCSRSINPNEKGILIYERDNVILCPTCSGEPTTRIFVKDFTPFQV